MNIQFKDKRIFIITMVKNFELTDEQRLICESVENGYNVIVDAVAGSGKTRTILEMVARNPCTKFCVLLYSAGLKAETRKRLKDIDGHDNAFIHSFHSAVNHISPPCHNDEHLLAFILDDDCQTRIRMFPTFDVLVVDECQDLTPLLLKVIMRLCHSQEKRPQIVILGDQYQCIYAYNGADARYLTMANQILKMVAAPKTWHHLTLSTTFRCPKSHASFVNHNVLQLNRLNVPDNAIEGKIAYHAVDAFGQMPAFITNWVLDKIKCGVSVTDIAILVAGVNVGPKHPIRHLVNQLAKNDVDIYMRNNNGYTSDEQMRHKLCILSFHQSKGLEFKYVIVLGFDESYRTYYDKGATPPGVVPNTIYVALTRAREDLLVVRYADSDPFDFLVGTADAAAKSLSPRTKTSEEGRSAPKTITDICRYLSVYTMNELLSFITVTQSEPEFVDRSDWVCLPDTVTTSRDLVEFVADLNGTVIHRLWQSELPLKHIDQDMVNSFFENAINDEVKLSKLIHRKRQLIDTTPWLSADVVRRLVRRAREKFDYDCETIVYEADAKIVMDGLNLRGSIDGYNVNTNTVYELTTAHTIHTEKILQTALYVAATISIHECDTTSIPKMGVIFNACTGQTLQIRVPDRIGLLNKMKGAMHHEVKRVCTREFLDSCNEIIDTVH